jgi:beta-hydroxylase
VDTTRRPRLFGGAPAWKIALALILGVPLLCAYGAFLLYIPALGWILHRLSRVGDTALFDLSLFPWIPALEAEAGAIRAELEGILASGERIPSFQEVSPPQAVITRDDRWKTFFLVGYDAKFPANAARCPRTVQALRRIPAVHTAFFSILEPNKRVPRHRGIYAGVLRLHLALIVPEPRERCAIRVGEQVTLWTEGRALVFDDTQEHEVWNETEGRRVVLFVDFERPLPAPLSWLNRATIWAVGKSPLFRGDRAR